MFLTVSNNGGIAPRRNCMGIIALGEALKGINPFWGVNPRGNCKNCARVTANTLTTGNDPASNIEDGTCKVTDSDEEKVIVKFQAGDDRSKEVWRWLTEKAVRSGVYAVDANNHAYNFLKSYEGEVYLIDSNQHIFRRIEKLHDFVATVYNEKLSDSVAYNYADPYKGENKPEKEIELYFKGNLAERWNKILREPDAPVVVRSRSASLSAPNGIVQAATRGRSASFTSGP